ncbi:ribbon-helix-helix protein, CopG family [Micromonospora okii]|uniref:ribbon-helix-helix protein, CopG family n=1 Tax=Micromonospora okii TaxID=1182970 RepID=UPI001E4AB6B1|nr:ribbon-helix-helix protein, CopG family [Micromonospora okii]
MDLTTYVENLRSELADAAGLGGEEARALAQRLTGPMESAFRLALLEALSAATAEITRDLAPGSVELRLRGREPAFVVTPPPAEPPPATTEAAAPPPEVEEGALTRISFRLPDQLKARIEEAAAREGLSVNAWLIRAATAAVQAPAPFHPAGRAPRGGQRYTGWAR